MAEQVLIQFRADKILKQEVADIIEDAFETFPNWKYVEITKLV